MREKGIWQKFANEVKKRGGICLKCVAPGYDGAPDRMEQISGLIAELGRG